MKKIKSLFVVVILFMTYTSFSQDQQIKPPKFHLRCTSSYNKNEPLVVIDNSISSPKILSFLPHEIIEDMYFLPMPLYLINGREYSEEELFGADPTSIYAPLSEQEIEYILAIKQEEAMTIYGEKGKNGVVIVSTKNGKPVKK